MGMLAAKLQFQSSKVKRSSTFQAPNPSQARFGTIDAEAGTCLQLGLAAEELGFVIWNLF
jgi:hypothetical protein